MDDGGKLVGAWLSHTTVIAYEYVHELFHTYLFWVKIIVIYFLQDHGLSKGMSRRSYRARADIINVVVHLCSRIDSPTTMSPKPILGRLPNVPQGTT